MNLVQILKTEKEVKRSKLLETGITDYEIKKLISYQFLTKCGRGTYKINKTIVNETLLNEKLENNKIITHQELLETGLNDQEIENLIKDHRINLIADGTYNTKPYDTKDEKLSINEISKALSNNDIDKIIELIDLVPNEEFIKLSKEILKWLVKTRDITSDIQIENDMQEKTANIDATNTNIDIDIETNDDINTNTSSHTITQSTVHESSVDIDNNKKKSTKKNITAKTAWNLCNYYIDIEDSVLAEESLNDYIELCKKEDIYINYERVLGTRIKISNIGVTKEALEKEKDISYEIKKRLLEPHTQDNIDKLEYLTDELYKISEGRGFFASYYKGIILTIKKEYHQAIKELKKIVDRDPNNYLGWKALSAPYIELKNYSEHYYAAKQFYCLTGGKNIEASTTLAISCFKNNKDEELKKIVDEVFENNSNNFLAKEKFIKILLNCINKDKAFFYYVYENTEFTLKRKQKYKRIIDILSYIEEKYNTLLVSRSLPLVSFRQEIESNNCQNNQVCSLLYDLDDDKLIPTKTLHYVKNLEIPSEENYLLCLATARFLFENKMPKQAEKYLKFVEKSKDKTATVKKELKQVINNKRLYLNK